MRRKRVKNRKEENTAVNVDSSSLGNRKKSKKGVIITIGILVAGLVLSGILGVMIYPGDAIAKGVSVEGINVGNMTVQNAKTVLQEEKLDNQKIVILDKSGEKLEFIGGEISLFKDNEKTACEAYKIGREEGLFGNIITLVKTAVMHKDLSYSYSYDTEKLSELIYNFGVSVIGEQKNYDVTYDGDTATVKKGQPGQKKDVSDLLDIVDKAFQNKQYEISIELKSTEAPTPTVDSVYDEIFSEAKNAEYEIIDGKLNIVPEVVGREVDKSEIENKIEDLKNGKSITIAVNTIMPEVTAESINREIFGYTLGEFSTSYASSSKNRAENVEIAANRINGIILMPNEEFSYNKVVGNRTVANGFKEAPVFENGETVQGMGGGVCQVSSTLYSAVLYADLKVVERKNHSMTVSYVPKGQDATVSYGSIDFRFKNDTKNPIKISASAVGRKLKIAILSKKPDREKSVKIINNVTSTKSPTTEEIVTAGMKAGERKTISSGKTGYTVSTVRKVFEDGKEVKSEKMNSSTYKMVPNKVAVGAGNVTPVFNETEVSEDENSGKKDTQTQKPTETETPQTVRPKANEPEPSEEE